MIDKSEVIPKRCRPDDFVRMALIVLGDLEFYEDELIEIVHLRHRRADDFLEITRKPMSQNGIEYTELNCDNPVTMVADGKIIRHHGEHLYLTVHLEKLVEDKGERPYLSNRTNKEGDDE